MVRAAVVGAGNMGAGIAQKMAQEGFSVTLVDTKSEYLEKGITTIKRMLGEGVERGVFSAYDADRAVSRIRGTVDYEELSSVDLVVEAVFESLEIKGEVFKALDRVAPEGAVLGTNTSSISVGRIASFTKRPERVVGMHYFYHPAKNRLLEVIPHPGTNPKALEKALLFGKLQGKTTIVVKDSPGFVVNRFFVPFLNESVRILEEGIAGIATIEEAARRAFQIEMGPFGLMNATGIPIAVHASTSLGKELGKFYETAGLLQRQMESGEDWELDGAVEESKVSAVMERLWAVTLGIAAHVVDEGVASVEDVDRGAKIGLRWTAGPFELMNRIGPRKVYEAAIAIHERNRAFSVPHVLEEYGLSGRSFVFRHVDLEVRGRIAFITINRPEAMNALNPEVIEQLEAGFERAEGDSRVDAIVLRGAGKAFVAGADIKFFVDNMREKRLDRTVEFTKRGHELFLKIEDSAKLTLAVVDGLSLGGGSELALACQAIVATEAGSFGFPETGIGIYPALGGTIRLARQVGAELAKYYLFTGKTLRAAEAFELGIVSALAEPANLEEVIRSVVEAGRPEKYRPREIPQAYRERRTICSKANAQALLDGRLATGVDPEFAAQTAKIIASKAPIALRIVDRVIDEGTSLSIRDAVGLELDHLIEIFSTKDALAGLSARPGRGAPFHGE